MKLPRAIRWRIIHYRARINYLIHVRLFPSYMQREFNRGDPHGIVREFADRIIAEIEKEDKGNA